MKMSTISSRTVSVFVAFFLVLISTASLATQNLDADRLSAARRLVLAAGIADLYVQGAHKFFSDATKTDPARKNEMAWKTAQVTVPNAAERIAPIYAEFLSATQADELRTFFTTGAGQKFWDATSRAALQGVPFTMPKLSAQEHQQVLSFTVSSNTWRIFSQAQPVIQKKMTEAAQLWGRELNERQMADFRRQIAAAVTGSDDSVSQPAQGGQSPEQQMLIAALRSYATRNRAGITRYQERVKQLDLITVLASTNLTSRDGIAQSRGKLDTFEQELNQRLREYNATTDSLIQSLKHIADSSPMGNAFLAGFEKSLTQKIERALRLEENQRTLISLSRQTLNLADERFGRIKIEGDQLLFDNDQDLQTYRELLQRIQKEGEIETQLELEEKQAQDAALRLLLSKSDPTGIRP
jgi:hypothetical protein